METERRRRANIERTMKLTIPEVELPNAELLGESSGQVRGESSAAAGKQRSGSQRRALVDQTAAGRRAGYGNRPQRC
ncbi:hypothetical protein M8494_25950 [Serratia ureilytica]